MEILFYSADLGHFGRWREKNHAAQFCAIFDKKIKLWYIVIVGRKNETLPTRGKCANFGTGVVRQSR